jgi:Lamin-B receptor of TUDOR domain
VHTQAAYNNTSEIELEECDVTSTGEPEMSLFPVGTKVAKQFEGDDQQLEWFESAIQRFDEDDKLYWVLYTDGDSEDMDEAEVRDAVHDHRVHLQQNEVTAGAAVEAVSSAPSITSVDVDMTDTARLAVDGAAPVGDTVTSQSPSSPHPSELVAAMQAMTAAAERLASAVTRIEAAVQTQRCERSLQPQQMISVLPNWQLHGYWQHVMLQQQQQQQQQRLVYYQHRQLLYWQQR